MPLLILNAAGEISRSIPSFYKLVAGLIMLLWTSGVAGCGSGGADGD